MVNCSSSGSMSARPRWQRTWRKRDGQPSQGWRTFLHNHADGIASMDLFVVPTVSFRLLYGVLILQHARRELLWLGVTAHPTHPTAEWIAQQLVEAFGWREIPRYLVRDRDCIYGPRFVRRLRAMGIRDRPTAGDLSAQSDESASTTSSSSTNAISGLCCTTTRIITMNVERTYRWTRMLQSRVRSTRRPHYRQPCSWRTASSILSNLSFR